MEDLKQLNLALVNQVQEQKLMIARLKSEIVEMKRQLLDQHSERVLRERNLITLLASHFRTAIMEIDDTQDMEDLFTKLRLSSDSTTSEKNRRCSSRISTDTQTHPSIRKSIPQKDAIDDKDLLQHGSFFSLSEKQIIPQLDMFLEADDEENRAPIVPTIRVSSFQYEHSLRTSASPNGRRSNAQRRRNVQSITPPKCQDPSSSIEAIDEETLCSDKIDTTKKTTILDRPPASPLRQRDNHQLLSVPSAQTVIAKAILKNSLCEELPTELNALAEPTFWQPNMESTHIGSNDASFNERSELTKVTTNTLSNDIGSNITLHTSHRSRRRCTPGNLKELSLRVKLRNEEVKMTTRRSKKRK